MKTLKIMSRALLVATMSMTSCVKQVIEEPGKKIVMLGDSETFKINSFSTWNTELGTTNTVNLGFNGFQTTHIINGALGSLPLQLTANENPELVYLTIGVNDVLGLISEATTIANIKIIVDSLTSINAQVIINLVTPLTKARNLTWGTGTAVYNQRIHDLNLAIADLCVTNGYQYMDQRPYFCYRNDFGIWELAEEFSIDGLHYNLEGYQQWCIPLTYNINQH